MLFLIRLCCRRRRWDSRLPSLIDWDVDADIPVALENRKSNSTDFFLGFKRILPFLWRMPKENSPGLLPFMPIKYRRFSVLKTWFVRFRRLTTFNRPDTTAFIRNLQRTLTYMRETSLYSTRSLILWNTIPRVKYGDECCIPANWFRVA